MVFFIVIGSEACKMNDTKKTDALYFKGNCLPLPVERYIKQHQEHIAISKLKHNIPLTPNDVTTLENLVYPTVASKELYTSMYGNKPLGEFVRELVGLDVIVVKEAFSDFLNNSNLNAKQIYVVNQIVEYFVRYGIMKDYSVLMSPPFTDMGSLVEIFTDSFVWADLLKIIEKLNANAET